MASDRKRPSGHALDVYTAEAHEHYYVRGNVRASTHVFSGFG